jgi:RNA polymerase sigma factor (sigma-70 family)
VIIAMSVNDNEEVRFVTILKEKNPSNFQYLYEAYAPILLGSIQKIVGCPIASQDVLQNVMVKIWTNADKYQAIRGRLFTWMINITRNESLDFIRSKHWRQASITGNGLEEVGEAATCSNKSIIRFDVRRLLNRLPLNERGILELYITGFTCKEIGRLFGLPEGTVKTRMRTSYRKLRMALQN